mgnify:CR=1 FL=1
MIQNITYKKKTLALIIRASYLKKKGINFFTKKNLTQQVAYMHHPKHYSIQPHLHKKLTRKIKGTSEVLIILSGKMKIDFYDNKKIFLFSKIANKNDIVVLLSGGHGFKILQNCKFIEVKQGPFFFGKDKKRF